MPRNLYRSKFKDIDINDPFFDSLKKDYAEFPAWFAKKADESAYIIKKDTGGRLRGFIYLKVETEAVNDITPSMPAARRLKIGTMKLEAHGTKLGERSLKKVFDHAVAEKVDEIYVTVFAAHTPLIGLLRRYGFEEYGTKSGPNGTELVFVRSFRKFNGDRLHDYPFVHTDRVKFYLLAVYPKYHTDLFPDSKLMNEDQDLVDDISHTNTIHKVYVARMALRRLKPNDVVVIYRTTDIKGKAKHRSVVTSVCVVEETYSKRSFKDVDDFIRFAEPRSVFDEEELRDWYVSTKRMFAVKMLYNMALKKRPNRHKLLTEANIPEQPRWDLKGITREEFDAIIELSQTDDSLIID